MAQRPVEEAYREYGWCSYCAQPTNGAASGLCDHHDAMAGDPEYSMLTGDEVYSLTPIESPYGSESGPAEEGTT